MKFIVLNEMKHVCPNHSNMKENESSPLGEESSKLNKQSFYSPYIDSTKTTPQKSVIQLMWHKS